MLSRGLYLFSVVEEDDGGGKKDNDGDAHAGDSVSDRSLVSVAEK